MLHLCGRIQGFWTINTLGCAWTELSIPFLIARARCSAGQEHMCAMCSILCWQCVVFCALLYFCCVVFCAPCSILCCTLLYTVHKSTVLCHLCCAPHCCAPLHCWIALFCVCAAHCFVPCIDPSFVPCTIQAVHKWCCQQLKLRWRSSIANGRRRLHKATSLAWWLHTSLVSNQLES